MATSSDYIEIGGSVVIETLFMVIKLMKSPFPGVDPYLEPFWGDIHTRLIVYISDQLDEQLPSGLQARVEESVSVDAEDLSRWVYPDVKIQEVPSSVAVATQAATATLAVAEPLLIPVPNEPLTHRHIEIVDLNSGNRVVTAIELLSPANKLDEGARKAYRRKQFEYIAGLVNLIEIDLIHSGEFIVSVPKQHLKERLRSSPLVCIRRVLRPDIAEIVVMPFDQPVPAFRIPLRPSDADVVLNLQPLLEECYRRGRYASSIDYSQPPSPPLPKPWDQWAADFLKHK